MLRIVFALFLIFAVSPVFSDEAAKEGSVGDVILYPAKVVKEGAEVTLEAGKNIVETVGGTAEGIVTGDVEKAVTTPVKGTAETVVDAAGGIATAPIDAAKTEEEELHKEEFRSSESEKEIPVAKEVSQTK